MRTPGCIVAVILFAFAPVALADSIQFTVNSSVHVFGGSPGDSWWGIYSTPPDAYGTTPIVHVSVPFGYAQGSTTFPNVSFFLPAGSVITSATMELIYPSIFVGTASVAIAQGLGPSGDFTGPHIPPTFNYPATISFYIEDVFTSIGTLPPGVFPNTPTINGNEISTGTWNLLFLGVGDIAGTVDTQGYNWAGYITGEGQADIPYSVQVDVDYTPVPEPPGFVLLGTAVLGLVGVACRKFTAS